MSPLAPSAAPSAAAPAPATSDTRRLSWMNHRLHRSTKKGPGGQMKSSKININEKRDACTYAEDKETNTKKTHRCLCLT